MNSKTLIAAVVASVSGAAFAHETAFPHVHPHGADLVVMAIGIAVLAWSGYKAGLFSEIRNKRD